jgi:very-short-patch-repair endonuclease
VPESVDTWWARRQRSKGVDVPYPIGSFRTDWERYPVLIRQYFPDQNRNITLTQIPPVAEVYLLWTCDVGHRFIATPEEQRNRPGRERRRSSWCPECAELAQKRSYRPAALVSEATHACGHPFDPNRVGATPADRCYLCTRLDSAPISRDELLALVLPAGRDQLAAETGTVRSYRWQCPRGHGTFEAPVEKIIGGRRCRVCRNADAAANRFAVGEAFVSPWAPKPASAAEAELRQALSARFAFDLSVNAVRVAKPFFNHVEVWPDFVLAELRVAIEYDTIGRHGLEHVGRREDVDRKKDRQLRAAGWEVIRVRVGKLQPLGPFDVAATSVSAALVDRIEERLGEICGELMVAAYRR